jgi:hypothetical protein
MAWDCTWQDRITKQAETAFAFQVSFVLDWAFYCLPALRFLFKDQFIENCTAGYSQPLITTTWTDHLL